MPRMYVRAMSDMHNLDKEVAALRRISSDVTLEEAMEPLEMKLDSFD